MLVGLSGVPRVDLFPFKVFSPQRSAEKIFPFSITYAKLSTLVFSRASCRSGARSATTSIISSRYSSGTRGTGDPVVVRQRGGINILAEPAQPQYCLAKAGQRPAVLAGTTQAPIDMEDSAHVLGEFAWHVEHGTTGKHGEPPDFGLDLRKSSPTRSSPPTTHRRHQPANALTHPTPSPPSPTTKLILPRHLTALTPICPHAQEISPVLRDPCPQRTGDSETLVAQV